MIECRKCLESLTALMDGELEGEEQEQIQLHVSSCDQCQQEYQSLHHVYQLTAALPPLEPSSYLWTRIKANLTAASLPHDWTGRFQTWLRARWAPVTAGVLGGALATVFLLQPAEVETEREFRVYVQKRERIEVQHSHLLQNGQREMVPVLHLNPFRTDDRPFRNNPFGDK